MNSVFFFNLDFPPQTECYLYEGKELKTNRTFSGEEVKPQDSNN